MTILRGILDDLRRRRLWPVAVLLLVALVAVPLLLSRSASAPAASTSPPVSGPAASAGPALPVVDESSAPIHSRFTNRRRNPFAQKASSTGAGTSTTPTTTTTPQPSPSTGGSTGGAGAGSGGSTTTGSGTTGSGGSGSGGSGSGGSGSGGSGSGSQPSHPSGLTPTESYVVALGVTDAAGSLNTIDPLVRLSAVPSASQPMLLDLGVLQGGHRVLFAVEPGAVVHGPGRCIPGPLDCELVSLAPNQLEEIDRQSTGTQVATFAVTKITVAHHSSAPSAQAARHEVAPGGRTLLSQTALPALSLFEYRPSIGAVVDLRNLTVGGGQ